MIYLDNAATTMRKPPQVVQAVVKALESIGNAGRGAYHASLDASRIIYDTRVKLVEFFGGDHAEQVAFTANSTESLNLVKRWKMRSVKIPGRSSARMAQM